MNAEFLGFSKNTVVDGTIVRRSEMIIREQEVIYPVDNLINDRPVTRSRGNVMDLLNVIVGEPRYNFN